MPEAIWQDGRVEGSLSQPSALQKRVQSLQTLARELAEERAKPGMSQPTVSAIISHSERKGPIAFAAPPATDAMGTLD